LDEAQEAPYRPEGRELGRHLVAERLLPGRLDGLREAALEPGEGGHHGRVSHDASLEGKRYRVWGATQRFRLLPELARLQQVGGCEQILVAVLTRRPGDHPLQQA